MTTDQEAEDVAARVRHAITKRGSDARSWERQSKDWQGVADTYRRELDEARRTLAHEQHDANLVRSQVRGLVERLAALDTAIEPLAAYAHEAWAGWMLYMFEKGTLNSDGTYTMPAWAVERWTRQVRTVYTDLPEQEKESDRKEARQMLAILARVSSPEADQATAPLEETRALCPRCGRPLDNVSPGISVIAGGTSVCTSCLNPGETVWLRARGLSS